MENKQQPVKPLDERQMLAANLWLTRQHTGMTEDMIAKEVGVSRRALYDWKQLSAWSAYVQDAQVSVAKQHLSEVLQNLVKMATKSSNVRAVQLYLQVCNVIGSNEPTVVVNNDDRSTQAVEAEIALLKKQLGIEDNVEPQKQPLTQKQKQDAEIESLLVLLKETEKPSLRLVDSK
jgi:hypothetical protein